MAAHGDPDRPPLPHRRRDVGGVETGDGRCHERHLLAEARPQRAVVGLDLELSELVRLRDEAQLADVQLVADQPGEPVDRRALVTGRDDHRRAERLA